MLIVPLLLLLATPLALAFGCLVGVLDDGGA